MKLKGEPTLLINYQQKGKARWAPNYVTVRNRVDTNGRSLRSSSVEDGVVLYYSNLNTTR